MAQLSPFASTGPEEILLPAKPWFVLFTMLCGLVANAMPVSGATLLLKPDFLALIVAVSFALSWRRLRAVPSPVQPSERLTRPAGSQ